ncbi:hypothetical protein SERLADRAFT_438621 [Serpula lacrymans var. lacrymans S7.9]|uniref:Uncharacterized protein n=1 Tax=Serpula lacrymans var. lacrymans (strain S7.9) TaxID=578457 RepID=F8NWJ1_SERL9|nr:uncharacterized protein SERLADRAFT_438621 [Serpula lacrymans var. lacrymans S7.9]EGO25016.1 hypothetical protein SERLADRAFT_438621 [Serpula lacrymans var. lacrymans S7.9]
MRSFASGLEMFLALGFDFVIRRNIRIRFRSQKPSKFLSSIHGTHHIRLANHIANSWNSLLSTEPTHSNNSQELKARPVLSSINTKESFGLGPSNHSSTFGGLIEVKTEADFDEQDLSLDQLVLDAEIEPTSILQCLDIDPNLLTYASSQPGEMMAITEPTALADSSQSGPLKRKVPFYDLTEELGPIAGALEGPLQKKSRIPTAQETTANTLSTSATNAPSTPATNASSIQAKGTPSTSNIISMFFAPGSKTVAPKCPSDKHTSQNLMAAFSPLADPNLNGLSRSQRIFSISTGIDPRSLTLNSSAEFFLFMDMRLQNKWALFSMTSRKWVLATADYNSRLEKLPKSGGSPAVMKNPRALFDKLGEIETKIVERIKSNNFVSSSGNEKFWRTHCFIVQLVKGENTDLKSRKTQICSCCRTIKYPGLTGFSGNHKKLFCSDGVPVRKDFPDELPPWPQPQGIFVNGTHFHPRVFLSTIREIYEKVIIEGGNGADLEMEYQAFAAMLVKRMTPPIPNSPVLFRLYESLTLSPPMPDLVKEHEGKKYLRVDCLSDMEQAVVVS